VLLGSRVDRYHPESQCHLAQGPALPHQHSGGVDDADDQGNQVDGHDRPGEPVLGIGVLGRYPTGLGSPHHVFHPGLHAGGQRIDERQGRPYGREPQNQAVDDRRPGPLPPAGQRHAIGGGRAVTCGLVLGVALRDIAGGLITLLGVPGLLLEVGPGLIAVLLLRGRLLRKGLRLDGLRTLPGRPARPVPESFLRLVDGIGIPPGRRQLLGGLVLLTHVSSIPRRDNRFSAHPGRFVADRADAQRGQQRENARGRTQCVDRSEGECRRDRVQ